jgi:hypothetical protein
MAARRRAERNHLVLPDPEPGVNAGLFCPKGWHKSAQGNALGTEGEQMASSPERAIQLVGATAAITPFQGSQPVFGFDSQGVALG